MSGLLGRLLAPWLLSPSSPVLASASSSSRARSTWRYDGPHKAYGVYPNYKFHLTHRKHYHEPHTWGVQKKSRMRVVDNSKLGREAMAEGRAPYIINVFSEKHKRRPHESYGALGDRVLMAVKGEKVQGIIVGLRCMQRPNVPKFDSNNVVLIEPNGNPLGTRIHAPVPNCIRPILARRSHHKRADYTKIMAIARTI